MLRLWSQRAHSSRMSCRYRFKTKQRSGKLRASEGRKGPHPDEFPILKLTTGLVLFPAKLNGRHTNIAVDTGSAFSIIALRCVPKGSHIHKCSEVLEGVSGPVTPVGWTKIRFFARGLWWNEKVIVLRTHIFDMVVETQFCEKYDVKINFKKREIQLTRNASKISIPFQIKWRQNPESQRRFPITILKKFKRTAHRDGKLRGGHDPTTANIFAKSTGRREEKRESIAEFASAISGTKVDKDNQRSTGHVHWKEKISLAEPRERKINSPFVPTQSRDDTRKDNQAGTRHVHWKNENEPKKKINKMWKDDKNSPMLACYNATVAKVQTPVVEPDRFNPEGPNSQDNGEKYIPQWMLAQRKARQDKTEQFPCHLLQTRESWNPQKASNYQTATDEAVPRVLDQLIQAQEVVKARRIGNPTETVTLANRSQRQTRFKPGDLVVVSNPTRHIGEMDELIHIFKEPCEVVSKTSQGHYQVEGTTRDNEIIFETVHGSRLIPYYPRF